MTRHVSKQRAIEHMSLASISVVGPGDFTCWGTEGRYLDAVVLDISESGCRKLLEAIEPHIQLDALPEPPCTCKTGKAYPGSEELHTEECQITLQQARQGIYRQRILRALNEIERVVPIWKSLPADDRYGKGFNVGRARAYEHIAEILKGIA